MRQEKELELLAELRGYYTHYPYGHGVMDVHSEWRKGVEIWHKIVRLSTELQDQHKTLERYKSELKEEGLIREL